MVFRILAGKPGQTSSAGGPRLQLRAAQPTVCIENLKEIDSATTEYTQPYHFFLLEKSLKLPLEQNA